MDMANILVLINGLLFMWMGCRFGYVAYMTRFMRDPLGRSITPRLFGSLTILFIVVGLRNLIFTVDVLRGNGIWATGAGHSWIVFDLWVNLFASVFVLVCIRDVHKQTLSVPKKA